MRCYFKYLNFVRPYSDTYKIVRNFSNRKLAVILGIESSCDDTGCGIVDTDGNVLGEASHSQHSLHLKYGGIIPPIAREEHRQHITTVCENALRSANLRLQDVDAIATTVKPGLPLSLEVGKKFGIYLSIVGRKPFIPIHHMQAHALTIRMVEKVDFPYLVLLISGGHSLLAVVQHVDKFYILGSTRDNAPGEILDKMARRMRLHNMPEFQNMNGGQAIETAAKKATNLKQFFFEPIMHVQKNCEFSFAGIGTQCLLYITQQEKKHGIEGNEIIPDIYNLCASLQLAVAEHLCSRTQRAIEFLDLLNVIPKDNRVLVISGGVACNNFIANALNIICSEMDYGLVRTPPKLCTDNGIMIAWNGAEKWLTNTDIITEESKIRNIQTEKRSPIGEDWRQRVQDAKLQSRWIKIKKKLLEILMK